MASCAPEVVILDQFLRDETCRGTDIAIKLQNAYPGVRILFVSGTSMGDWSESDRRNIATLPRDSYDFLAKPFTSRDFLSKVAELMSRPQPIPALVGEP
jgi:FixJ family two-component response regulator